MEPGVALAALAGRELVRSCVVCGAVFETHPRERNRRKYCSEACRLRQYRQSTPELAERRREMDRLRSRENYSPRPKVIGECVECGSLFEGRRGRKYCSAGCSNRAFGRARVADGRAADLNAERRAREAGVKVSRGRRIAVLERDGWVCQLCGEPTDRTVKYPHPDFPVIDHIVPLALGGAHEMSNWQTAHNRCNAKKGARLVA